METRDTEAGDVPGEAPPGWVLSTPTRRREVWTFPVLVLLLALAHVVLAVAFGGAFALVLGVGSAIIFAAGAVVLFVTGRRAYDEQSRPASWRNHTARVVVGTATAVVVGVAGVLVGLPLALLFGVVSVSALAMTARTVPRFDHLAAAWASLVVAVTCAVLAVVALAGVEMPEYRRAGWVAGGVFGVLAGLIAAHQFRAAARAALDEPESGLSAPDRTAS